MESLVPETCLHFKGMRTINMVINILQRHKNLINTHRSALRRSAANRVLRYIAIEARKRRLSLYSPLLSKTLVQLA